MKMNKNKRKVKDTRAQDHKGTRSQRHKSIRAQEHKGTKIKKENLIILVRSNVYKGLLLLA